MSYLLLAVYVGALALAVGGLYKVLSGSALFVVAGNKWGVPHWAPTAMSLVLVLIAALTWSRDTTFQLLAVHWAVGAAALSRVGLLPTGVDLRLEYVSLLTSALLVTVAIVYAPPWSVRAALYAAGASSPVAFVAMAVPANVPPIFVDFPVYFVVLVLATFAIRAAMIHHQPKRSTIT